MIYLILCGRLGNQLFQYAFAKKIQLETGQELAIDFTAIEQKNNDEWKNYLNNYNISEYKIVNRHNYYPIQRFAYRFLRMIRPRGDEKKQYYFDEYVANHFSKFGLIFYETDYKCHSFSLIKTKNILIRGWFESEQYFDTISEELKNELTLKHPLYNNNQELYNKLLHDESICVSIRRGNFTEDNFKRKFLICTPDYYYKAVEFIRQRFPKSSVYVCSDDIEWCKKELKFAGEVLFEPPNDVCEKLVLMSACRHFVLSNSTFSWWAQYLSDSKDKIVVSPNKWRNCELPPQDIFGKGWFYLNKAGEISNERDE